MKITTGITLATLLVAGTALAATRQLVEGIVVRVNDKILTTSDIRQRAAERAAETGMPVPPAAYPELIQDAADELCILERAAELKLEVSNEEVNTAVKQLRERNNVADDATFVKMLQGMGLTLDDLKVQVRDNILIQRLLQREVGDLPLTEAELRQRYAAEKSTFMIGERVHLEHIVMPVLADGSDLESRMAAARRLVAAARATGDFLALVKQEVAAGHGSGGDLGTLLLTDLRPEVRDAVVKLKPGEISDPFTSTAGVHVVRLLERIPPTVRPFDQVEQQLRERELEKRYKDHLAAVVSELKKRYIVETHPELMATNK
jgi:peptidyl-prolyl cis-trans isomerase SurA